MTGPLLRQLFENAQELEEAAEQRYLENEFKLGDPTYPELEFEQKARLRTEVIRVRVAGELERQEIQREAREDRTRDAAGLE
jgi:hypothetical protein